MCLQVAFIFRGCWAVYKDLCEFVSEKKIKPTKNTRFLLMAKQQTSDIHALNHIKDVHAAASFATISVDRYFK